SGYSNIGHDSAAVKRFEKKVSSLDGAVRAADTNGLARLEEEADSSGTNHAGRRIQAPDALRRTIAIGVSIFALRHPRRTSLSLSIRESQGLRKCGKRPCRSGSESPDGFDTQAGRERFDGEEECRFQVPIRSGARAPQILTTFPLRTDCVCLWQSSRASCANSPANSSEGLPVRTASAASESSNAKASTSRSLGRTVLPLGVSRVNGMVASGFPSNTQKS